MTKNRNFATSSVVSLIIREEHGIHCMPCSSRLVREMLSEIHTLQKFDFLKPIIHSQTISCSVSTDLKFLVNGLLCPPKMTFLQTTLSSLVAS